MVKDKEGQLYTEFKHIERIVLEELSKIFSGKKSKIFTSHNEQIIQEMFIQNKSAGWEEWIPKMKPNREFEEEIFSKVTITQVEAIINDLKENRASGVDGITSNMLKLFSLAFRTKLMDLVNDVLQFGEVPESLLNID